MDSVYVIDRKRRLTRVNRRYTELVRKSTDRCIGEKCFKIMSEATTECPNCSVTSVFERAKAVRKRHITSYSRFLPVESFSIIR
ncbi:MAG: hypothetical protein ACLFSB_06965 [Chitinispirillaceae bacterium]